VTNLTRLIVREVVLPNYYVVETASQTDATGVHFFPQMAERERGTYARYVTLMQVWLLEYVSRELWKTRIVHIPFTVPL